MALALKTHKLPIICWQYVLPDALHSIGTLLCIATNETPHERMFNFQCRSTTESSIPSWLATPGPMRKALREKIKVKRYVRKSKFGPLVDEVELIEVNPNHAHYRFPERREDTVALKKHLGPKNDQEPKKHSQAQKQLSKDSN